MKRISPYFNVPSLAFCILWMIAANALADTVVAPNYAATTQSPNSADAAFPNVLREQTVYGASEFPSYPVLINEIRWRPDSINGGPITTTISNIQVSLSTTTYSADNLSGTFSQNTGTNEVVAFSGAMNVASSFTTLSNGTMAFDIDLPLQTSFLYDPSKGNLLLDLRNFTGCSASLFDNGVSGSSDTTSRIYNTTDPNATTASGGDSGAGVIEIVYSPAPALPSIDSQPTNRSVLVGGAATFTATAAGAPPLNYQWFFNDTNNPVSGATSSSLTLTNLQLNQGGNYFVEVTNLYGAIFSSNALLTVIAAPTILSGPNDQIVPLGATATFNLTVGGVLPFSYQWFFNVTNAIAGATNTSLTLSNVQFASEGTYSVQVSNSYGLTNSSNANLFVGLVAPNYAATVQNPNSADGVLRFALREQTIYGTSEFPAYPIIISDIRWRPDSNNGGPITTMISNIQVNLSTTTNRADHLSSTFSQNIGTNDTVVFSGVLNVTSSFTTLSNGIMAFDIDLPLQTPFLYDPAKGNLLLDVRNFTGCNASLFDNGATGTADSVSRVYNANDPNAPTASGSDSGAGVIEIGYAPAPIPPTIASQPTNHSVTVGGAATFSVVAGPLPLSYQWFFNTNTALMGATNSSLTLTNIQIAQAGTYSLRVSNAYGSTASTFATLIVSYPPAIFLFGTTNVMGGNSFDLPVYLVANGNENTLSFSMNFPTQQMTYAAITLGNGAADASLLPNTSQAASGRIGVSLQLPGGEAFIPGTQEVVRVTFSSAIVSGTQIVAPINFTNQPINKLLFDLQGNKLATNFVNGTVTLTPTDLEGDVNPRPTGDRSLDIFDWSQVGRFVAGLDAITNAAEFQRADCAPKSTSGDGQLKVTDWVQAGRYGAAIDPPAPVGGPSASVPPTLLSGGPRTLSIGAGTAVKGLNVTLPVTLQSQGNENGVGFSLTFDPAILKYAATAKGSSATSATMNVNSNQAASGTLGVVLALPAGNNFTAGAQEIARITFTALNSSTNSTVSFSEGPVLLAISDPLANELSASYSNSSFTINPPPTLSIGLSNGAAALSWPTYATGFNLQGASNVAVGGWTNVGSTPQTNASDISVTLPLPDQGGYFRLQHP